MGKSKVLVAEFDWVGQLLDFVIKDGYKLKYLRLAVTGREYWVKVPKPLRAELDPAIVPGNWLAVRGWASRCRKTGKLKLRAESIVRVGAPAGEAVMVPLRSLPETPPAARKPAKVLVCTKSSCRKRGAEAICAALQADLQARGLTEAVEIRTTGCLKACKHGPNAVFMPGKARYGSLQPSQIPPLVAKHFATGEGSGGATPAEPPVVPAIDASSIPAVG